MKKIGTNEMGEGKEEKEEKKRMLDLFLMLHLEEDPLARLVLRRRLIPDSN